MGRKKLEGGNAGKLRPLVVYFSDDELRELRIVSMVLDKTCSSVSREAVVSYLKGLKESDEYRVSVKRFKDLL